MSGGGEDLKGISRYFNSTTIRGRANVAIATYSVLISYFLYAKFLKPSLSRAPDCSKCPPESPNRHEIWIRVKGYVNHYISKETLKCLKQAQLTTISFIGGFILYQNIFKAFILEKDCDCHCPRPQLFHPQETTTKSYPLIEEFHEESDNAPKT